MRRTAHPWTYPLSEHFPNRRDLAGWEGGGADLAEKDGKFFILVSECMMADFLDENDPCDREVLDRLVQVLEFDTAAERTEYIAGHFEQWSDRPGDVMRPKRRERPAEGQEPGARAE